MNNMVNNEIEKKVLEDLLGVLKEQWHEIEQKDPSEEQVWNLYLPEPYGGYIDLPNERIHVFTSKTNESGNIQIKDVTGPNYSVTIDSENHCKPFVFLNTETQKTAKAILISWEKFEFKNDHTIWVRK